MKGPPGIRDSQNQECASEVSLKGSDGNVLKEFKLTHDNTNNVASCYVLTAINDVITIQYSMAAGMADFIDIVCDGVRRESAEPSKTGANFKGVIKKVLERGDIVNKKTNRRGIAKYSKLLVCMRDTKKDNLITATERAQATIGTIVKTQSAVGTIEIQLFQKKSAGAGSQGSAQRAESFQNVDHWSDINHNVQEGSHISFELGFTEATKGSKPAQERVSKEWPGSYKLVGSFKFLFRSSEDLTALGYADIPDYAAQPRTSAASAAKVVEFDTRASTPTPSKAVTTKASTPDLSDDENRLFVKEKALATPQSLRTPKSAGNGRSTQHQFADFSGGLTQQSTSVYAIPPTSTLKEEQPPSWTQTLQLQSIPKAVTNTLSGIADGPAFEAWDVRQAKDEQRKQELASSSSVNQALDIRQPSQPAEALAETELTWDAETRHESVEPEQNGRPIPLSPILGYQANENSQAPTEEILEEEMEVIIRDILTTQATVDNTQTSSLVAMPSQLLTESQIELPVPLDSKNSDPFVTQPTQIPPEHIPCSSKQANISSPSKDDDQPLKKSATKVALTPTASGDRPGLPKAPRKDKKRKADPMDSPTPKRAETKQRKKSAATSPNSIENARKEAEIQFAAAKKKNEEILKQIEEMKKTQAAREEIKKIKDAAAELERTNAKLLAQLREMNAI